MPSRPRVMSAGLALCALAGAGVLSAPAAHASSATTSVTAFLRAPNLAGLDRLADEHGLTHAQRVAALAELVPTASSRAAVARSLVADGLSVTGETAWSVTASAPSAVVSGVFGARPAAVAHPTAADLRAETGPLPVLPPALAPYVSLVLPTAGGPAAFHHADAQPLNGTDFRNAYTSAGTTPPGSGATDDGNSTVATLQLADYSSSDLTTYASMQTPQLPNIVGTSKYDAITVDGGPSASDDSTGGDVEVDLDQESMLSTAPSATQRPYFAPNTQAGFNDVFSNVFDDVVQNAQANDGGDPNITALSSSWGGCESVTGADEIATTETLITALDAAGVTVFASSDDDGIYDCRDTTMTGLGNSQADVDYPASSPHVVGVGGTNLQFTGTTSTPNDGSNWAETSWTCSSTVSCESSVPETVPPLPAGTGGTGGGQSGSAHDASTDDSFKGFAAPAYQTATIKKGKFAKQPDRLVPDIAADGDPDTGFELYTSDPEYVGLETAGDGFLQVGGTSLSSPISAALFTNTLAAAGRHTGIGDIHGALYSAAADAASGAVRDITVGSNGAAADKGTDPSVSAGAGYDTNSGIGAVLWPAMTPYLMNTDLPNAEAHLALHKVHAPKKYNTVTVHWKGHRGNDKIDLGSSSVIVDRPGKKKPVFSSPTAPVSGKATFTGKPGVTYRMTVTTSDISGLTSSPSTTRLTVPIDDKKFQFSPGWHRHHGAREIAGSYASSNRAGATATVAATGSIYRLVVPTGPKRGKLGVYVGKNLVDTVNLYSASQGKQRITVLGGPTTSATRRVFHLKCLGKKVAASGGRSVAVDALIPVR